MKPNAWKKTTIKMMAVVRVLKSRGGMMALRLVVVSTYPAPTRVTTPTTSSAIVSAEAQFVSPDEKPTSRRTTPAMMRKRPRKSKVDTNSCKVRPWWGLSLSEKKRMARAKAPVGRLIWSEKG